jgi:hypothetical protein
MQMTGQSPGELLIECLRVDDAQVPSALAQLSGDDWYRVVEEAAKHDVTALVQRRVADIVPQEAGRRLDAGARVSAIRNLRLYQMLSEVLRALRAHEIPVIVLKGAYLAQKVYEDIAARSMNDVDLLVRRSDLAAARTSLSEIGYTELKKPHVDPEFYAPSPHVNPLVNRHGIPVELHWTLETGPFAVDFDDVWERARTTTIAGVEILALSPEDLLLHLSLHIAFHHQFNQGLRPFADIARVVEHHRGEMDWNVLISRANGWRMRKHAYMTLRLAQELLDAAVPGHVLSELKPAGFDPRLVALAKAEILFEEAMSPRFARLFGARRPLQKLHLLARSAFPPPREMARLYGARRRHYGIYFSYPMRWIHLMIRYGGAAWRSARGNEAEILSLRQGQERAAFLDWLHSIDRVTDC